MSETISNLREALRSSEVANSLFYGSDTDLTPVYIDPHVVVTFGPCFTYVQIIGQITGECGETHTLNPTGNLPFGETRSDV